MPNRRPSFIEVLRTRPDVRREYAFYWGLLILGYCFHTWVDSFLIIKMSKSMKPIQAANLGGVLAGGVAVAVGVTTGWLSGRWLIEYRRPDEFVDNQREYVVLSGLQNWFDSYPISRGLVLASLALLVGAAMGFWLLLASLTMILAFSLGYWGRAMALRR
jgi:hypothetical protein